MRKRPFIVNLNLLSSRKRGRQKADADASTSEAVGDDPDRAQNDPAMVATRTVASVIQAAPEVAPAARQAPEVAPNRSAAEGVALWLLEIIAAAEGEAVASDEDWVLSTYAECLRATRGLRRTDREHVAQDAAVTTAEPVAYSLAAAAASGG